jgi:WD40 repeat protein
MTALEDQTVAPAVVRARRNEDQLGLKGKRSVPLFGSGSTPNESQRMLFMAFSPDGQLLASSSLDNTVRLWDPTTGALQKTLEGHSGWVRSVTFSPDGRLLASASDDHTVRLWDPATG